MLKIFFGDNPGDNYIFNPDVFFITHMKMSGSHQKLPEK